MRKRCSVWGRPRYAMRLPLSRLPLSPLLLTVCCWFRLSALSATPATDCCRNPNGLLVPKAPAPPLNRSFISFAPKSGAEVSVSRVSPTSRLTCPPPRTRNALFLSLLLCATQMAEFQMAKAEWTSEARRYPFTRATCKSRLLKQNITTEFCCK